MKERQPKLALLALRKRWTEVVNTIIGRKLGMTSIFTEKGQVIPVTVIEAGPMTVVQVKTPDKDGYSAIQIGFGEKKQQRMNKPELGHLRKAEVGPKQVLREIRVSDDEIGQYQPGQTITLAEIGLTPDGFVDVIGVSKGKGFQGVMRRHNFKGYSGSHGAHEYRRHAGSIGTSATPSRVLKGRRMPGHMGASQVTMMSIKVVEVRVEQNLLFINGAAPGFNEGIVLVRSAKKKSKKGQEAA
jgi:large subunit ribosomal protein L3